LLSKQRVTGVENPDYATYAQVIATLLIVLAIESGTGSFIPGASAKVPQIIQDRVPKEIARREVGWYGLWIALVVFILDLLVLAASLSRDAIAFLDVWLVWANIAVFGGIVLLIIFGWRWQLTGLKAIREAELARRAAEETWSPMD
jgi:hypothetical protein